MKTLVYTTAFRGEHYFLLAEAMMRSLRVRGYAGDAVVVSDRPHPFAADLELRNLVLSDPARPTLLKAALPHLADVSGYDRVLHVDSDAVFLRDPAPLFGISGDRMLVSRERIPLSRHDFNKVFLTEAERREAARTRAPSANTGIIAFPGGRFAEYAEKWLRAWRSPPVRRRVAHLPYAQLFEQPVMQVMMLRGEAEYAWIPDELYLMPLLRLENRALHPDAVVVHFVGAERTPAQKIGVLDLVSRFTACASHGEFKAICDRLREEA